MLETIQISPMSQKDTASCYNKSRKSIPSEGKVNNCTATMKLSLSIGHDGASSSTTNVTTADTIPSPNNYNWTPALYQHKLSQKNIHEANMQTPSTEASNKNAAEKSLDENNSASSS